MIQIISVTCFLFYQMYIDGGITDNLYIFEEGRTITVSPFSGPQDISPKDPTSKLKHIHMKNQDFQVRFQTALRKHVHAIFHG